MGAIEMQVTKARKGLLVWSQIGSGVQEVAENIVRDCKRCQAYGGIESRAPMVSLKVTTPASTHASRFHIIRVNNGLG